MSCVRADRTWKLKGSSYWCLSDAQVMQQRDLDLECGLGLCISDETPKRCCCLADHSCNGAQLEAVFFFLKAYFYLLERQRKKESYRDLPSSICWRWEVGIPSKGLLCSISESSLIDYRTGN